MLRKILMFAGLPAVFVVLLIAVAAAPATTSAPTKEDNEKVVPATAKKEAERKEQTVPVPNTDLLNFIGKYHQALMDAAASGDVAYISSFDGKLSDFIASAGYRVFATALRKNPYGTVVHISSFQISGEPVTADLDVLVYMKDYEPDTKLDIMIYPTALLITDSSENLDIYAVDSLSAYKACCASLNQQLSSAANIAALKRQTAEAQMQASIAQQQAENAQQQAYMAQLQAQDAQQQANAAQEQANTAALQSYYNYYDRYSNNDYFYGGSYYSGGGYYGPGPIIVYHWNNRPPFPPRPPRPHPGPKPSPGPEPRPEPRPRPRPEANTKPAPPDQSRSELASQAKPVAVARYRPAPNPAPVNVLRPNPAPPDPAAFSEARPVHVPASAPESTSTPKTAILNGDVSGTDVMIRRNVASQ
ncbi:MAG: hypothetical protein AB7F40_07420 [Victivallaceae bacterium]|nr:hypothetical protein [Victivallaceae bacterium]